MTTLVAFSEIEAADVIEPTAIVVTTGNAVEAGVNRAAISLSSKAVFETTLPNGINEGWFHSRIIPRGVSGSAGAAIDYMMSIVDENGNIIAGFYDNRNSSGGFSHTPQVRAVIFSDPNIGVSNDNTTGTLILTPNGSAYLFDLYFKIHETEGVIRWYINGTLMREFLGDTKNGASSLIKKIRFKALGRSGDTTAQGILQFSQVLVSTLPTINARVHTIPLVAGSVTEWTGVVTDINGSDISTSTIMSEATIGDALIMATTDTAATILTGNEIKDVIISASALKVDGALVNRLKGKVKIGGTEYDSVDKPLTSGFSLLQFSYPINPATSSQWTIADINSAELGLETVA